MRRAFSILLLFMTLTSCSFERATSELTIHLPISSISLDPHKMQDMYSMAVVLQLFRGLFRYSPEGELTPDLVSAWTVSPDGKTYLFKLREAQFSNGSKITSRHVVN